jgi:hypothetical protein
MAHFGELLTGSNNDPAPWKFFLPDLVSILAEHGIGPAP